MTEQRLSRTCGAGFVPLLLTGCSGQQSALNPASPQAGQIAQLWWAMAAVATGVTVLVVVLLLVAVFRARRSAQPRPLHLRQSRNMVIAGGIILPVAVAVPLMISSFSISRSVDPPPTSAAALTVEVDGKLWWWEVRYRNAQGEEIATTANEIHIPVGVPVRFVLRSDNVIHSFWVPNLQGKVDMVPGRTNVLTLQADEEGVYRGECAEYCGTQHALMAFLVVVEPPEHFETWLQRQSEPAVEPVGAEARRGQDVFLRAGCSECHTVRGTAATADLGPDLTHVASRRTLAAATIPNSIGHLGGWIADPQHVKPGNKMPPTALSPRELKAVIAYLETLE